jgi:hypothetical protein
MSPDEVPRTVVTFPMPLPRRISCIFPPVATERTVSGTDQAPWSSVVLRLPTMKKLKTESTNRAMGTVPPGGEATHFQRRGPQARPDHDTTNNTSAGRSFNAYAVLAHHERPS